MVDRAAGAQAEHRVGLAMMKFQELKLKADVAAKRVRDRQVSALARLQSGRLSSREDAAVLTAVF